MLKVNYVVPPETALKLKKVNTNLENIFNICIAF